MWYAIVAILILIADQGLKYWVTVNIALDTGHVTLIPGVLELTNIHNNGAAFSMLEHAPHWIFILFTLVFAAIAVFCLRRNVVHGKVGRWSVVLVLAGAVGNCIDRILSGYVVDMFNFLFVRFAVFNLADVFIVVAGITLCLHVIFYRGDDGADDAAPKAARKQRTGAAHDAPKARRLHLPARRRPSAAPEANAKPAPNAAPASAAPEAASAKDDLFAAWDRAPVAAQPVTPAAPKPAAPAAPEAAAPAPKPAAPVQPKPAAPVQPKPAAQPAAEAADPLLAYLNSTPAAPAEPETPKPDDNTDGSADGTAYSLDDILAEFSDF